MGHTKSLLALFFFHGLDVGKTAQSLASSAFILQPFTLFFFFSLSQSVASLMFTFMHSLCHVALLVWCVHYAVTLCNTQEGRHFPSAFRPVFISLWLQLSRVSGPV